MKHRPVVTRFRTRPIRNPHGHWMNRLWWPLANGLMSVVGRVPVYRYILRPHEDALSVLDGDEPVIFACCHQDIFDSFNGLPRLFQDRRFAAIPSYSRDGGLAALGLRMLHYEVVRGSSSRGGGEGLLMLRSSLDSGRSVVFAAGPARRRETGGGTPGGLVGRARAPRPLLGHCTHSFPPLLAQGRGDDPVPSRGRLGRSPDSGPERDRGSAPLPDRHLALHRGPGQVGLRVGPRPPHRPVRPHIGARYL
jgi:hypothetical protein